MFIKNIESIPRDNEIAVFKKGYKPLWENAPESAFWFYRFHPGASFLLLIEYKFIFLISSNPSLLITLQSGYVLQIYPYNFGFPLIFKRLAVYICFSF